MLTPTEINDMTASQIMLEALGNDEVRFDTDDLLVNLVGWLENNQISQTERFAECKDFADEAVAEIKEQLINLYHDANDTAYEHPAKSASDSIDRDNARSLNGYMNFTVRTPRPLG